MRWFAPRRTWDERVGLRSSMATRMNEVQMMVALLIHGDCNIYMDIGQWNKNMWKDSLESHNAFIIIIIIPFSSFIIKTLTPRSIGKPGRLLGSTQHPNFSFYSRTTLSAEKSNYHAFCRYMQYCINPKISFYNLFRNYTLCRKIKMTKKILAKWKAPADTSETLWFSVLEISNLLLVWRFANLC